MLDDGVAGVCNVLFCSWDVLSRRTFCICSRDDDGVAGVCNVLFCNWDVLSRRTFCICSRDVLQDVLLEYVFCTWPDRVLRGIAVCPESSPVWSPEWFVRGIAVCLYVESLYVCIRAMSLDCAGSLDLIKQKVEINCSCQCLCFYM
jgi:hypothetical protein